MELLRAGQVGALPQSGTVEVVGLSQMWPLPTNVLLHGTVEGRTGWGFAIIWNSRDRPEGDDRQSGLPVGPPAALLKVIYLEAKGSRYVGNCSRPQ